jgi:hypothetical protein
MKKILPFLAGFVMAISVQGQQSHLIPIFDTVLFYDNNISLTNSTLQGIIQPLPEGVHRLSTSVVTTKLSEATLSLLSGSMWMNVALGAACDDFDRIGRVNLAFVPKDSTNAYLQGKQIQRTEIARFITPFLNKNVQPTNVPYVFQISHLQHIFQDKNLRDTFDFWIELNIGGNPYSAGASGGVQGCAGRLDVFYGSLNFFTTPTSTDVLETDNVFIPLFSNARFNNFETGASDTLGKTIRSTTFTVKENLTDAQLVLIISNHGSNTCKDSNGNTYPCGEEYNRRQHFVYFNGAEVPSFLPGRTSCEPFRIYNTLGNNIYGGGGNHGPSRSDENWQSRSNWCPGDVIDIRIINVGALSAGEHTFKIEVPDAVFPVGDPGSFRGNFPLTLFFQGKTSGTLNQNPERLTVTGTVRGNAADWSSRNWPDTIVPWITISNDRGSFSVTNYVLGRFILQTEANTCMTLKATLPSPPNQPNSTVDNSFTSVNFARVTGTTFGTIAYPFEITVENIANDTALSESFRIVPIDITKRDTVSIKSDTTVNNSFTHPAHQLDDTLSIVSDTTSYLNNQIIITDTITIGDRARRQRSVAIRDTIATLVSTSVMGIVWETNLPDTLTGLWQGSLTDTIVINIRVEIRSDTAETVGISGIIDDPNFIKVYPNPINEILHIQAEQAIAAIAIYNSGGQLVAQQYGDKNSINVSGLPKGMYIVRIRFTDGVVVSRMVVK